MASLVGAAKTCDHLPGVIWVGNLPPIRAYELMINGIDLVFLCFVVLHCCCSVYFEVLCAVVHGTCVREQHMFMCVAMSCVCDYKAGFINLAIKTLRIERIAKIEKQFQFFHNLITIQRPIPNSQISISAIPIPKKPSAIPYQFLELQFLTNSN